jgi:hypothetical protein
MNEKPDARDAQKSEAHEVTEDAVTSPANESKRNPDNVAGIDEPKHEMTFEEREKTFPDGVRLRRDESDVGGPIVIEIDEKELGRAACDHKVQVESAPAPGEPPLRKDVEP